MADDATGTPLLDAARAGDRGALEALLARHQAQIYRFSRAMCDNPEDAGDVLQDTMLALARHVSSIRGPSLSTWLYAVARSGCAKKRRRSRFAPAHTLDVHDATLPVADPGRSPEASLASARLDLALQDAIASLEPMYREVLLLRDVEGMSAAEVAATLGVREGAVKSRLHRARRQVRDALAPLLGGEPLAPQTGCPDVIREFSRNLEGEISAETCASLERHLAGCARCRQTCDALKETLSLCKSAPAPVVPAEIQRSVRVALQNFLLPG